MLLAHANYPRDPVANLFLRYQGDPPISRNPHVWRMILNGARCAPLGAGLAGLACMAPELTNPDPKYWSQYVLGNVIAFALIKATCKYTSINCRPLER